MLFVPLKGVSAIDVEGQPFRDAEADEALFAALREGIDPGKVEVHEVDADVNDPAFAVAMADRLHELIQEARHDPRRGAGAAARARSREGRPVIGAGAGTGLSAKCAQDGGADLIIIYNSGRYRMAGRGSLAGMMPYGDANAIVMDMAREVLPVARDTRGAGRRVRHRSRSASCRTSSRRSSAPASPACRTSPPSGSSTGRSASAWRRPAWATASRSR